MRLPACSRGVVLVGIAPGGLWSAKGGTAFRPMVRGWRYSEFLS